VVREIIKLAVAAAIILIAGSLIALFASGYISAFKPGGTKDVAGEHVVGSTNTIGGGGVPVVSTPAPSPSPQPAAGMPETVQVPPGPEPTMLPLQPFRPPVMPAIVENPPVPVMQPSALPGVPDSRIIWDRPTPVPTMPALQPPGQAPAPGFAWPALPLPGQSGWMQTSNWLLRIMPVLFPGLFPGWTWWPTP
jgi:hypothetical protein